MHADSSGLVSLLDRNEVGHEQCLAAIERYGGPLHTTWPAFTEAMYLLHQRVGWNGVEALWAMCGRAHLRIADQGPGAQVRMHDLMSTYRNVPMALADASLVTLAEERREQRILSLDPDFHVYVATWDRRKYGLEVIPGRTV